MKEKNYKIALLKKWIQKFQKEPFDFPGRSQNLGYIYNT